MRSSHATPTTTLSFMPNRSLLLCLLRCVLFLTLLISESLQKLCRFLEHSITSSVSCAKENTMATNEQKNAMATGLDAEALEEQRMLMLDNNDYIIADDVPQNVVDDWMKLVLARDCLWQNKFWKENVTHFWTDFACLQKGLSTFQSTYLPLLRRGREYLQDAALEQDLKDIFSAVASCNKKLSQQFSTQIDVVLKHETPFVVKQDNFPNSHVPELLPSSAECLNPADEIPQTIRNDERATEVQSEQTEEFMDAKASATISEDVQLLVLPITAPNSLPSNSESFKLPSPIQDAELIPQIVLTASNDNNTRRSAISDEVPNLPVATSTPTRQVVSYQTISAADPQVLPLVAADQSNIVGNSFANKVVTTTPAKVKDVVKNASESMLPLMRPLSHQNLSTIADADEFRSVLATSRTTSLSTNMLHDSYVTCVDGVRDNNNDSMYSNASCYMGSFLNNTGMLGGQFNDVVRRTQLKQQPLFQGMAPRKRGGIAHTAAAAGHRLPTAAATINSAMLFGSSSRGSNFASINVSEVAGVGTAAVVPAAADDDVDAKKVAAGHWLVDRKQIDLPQKSPSPTRFSTGKKENADYFRTSTEWLNNQAAADDNDKREKLFEENVEAHDEVGRTANDSID